MEWVCKRYEKLQFIYVRNGIVRIVACGLRHGWPDASAAAGVAKEGSREFFDPRRRGARRGAFNPGNRHAQAAHHKTD